MKITHLIITIFLSFICTGIYSQAIITYDDSGNRTQRKTLFLDKRTDSLNLPEQENLLFKYDSLTYLDELAGGLNFELWPNPTGDVLNISTNKPGEEIILELYTMEGELIISKNLIQQTDRIDLSKFSSGSYFLKLHSKDDVSVWKIIKR
ncbi:MAG: T9SS type A sorting domain-containing protein [Bacteroidales bacterium]|nr:T9SS type A sorting domain-containing protein [Bacteroidales bacterium]